jgi:hypothetical protein
MGNLLLIKYNMPTRHKITKKTETKLSDPSWLSAFVANTTATKSQRHQATQRKLRATSSLRDFVA